MTIKEALIFSNKKLRPLDPNYIEGEILLSFCLDKNKEYLYSHSEQKLTLNQKKNFKTLIARRLKKEPIAYLINQKEFYGLNFYVDKNVLIPRPETELIIDEVLKITKDSRLKTIIDIGTGSGCIAITLAKLLPKAKIIAVDISTKALKTAKKNAKIIGVLKNIKFIKGALLKPLLSGNELAPASSPRLIIANLPYLTKNELKNVPHEPKTALYGGKYGLEYIEKLLSQAKNILNPNGIILLEISPTQVKKVKTSINKYLPEKKFKVIKDLNKLERIIKIY